MTQSKFESNEYMESLLRLQAEKPEVFKTLSPALRISVDRYAELKANQDAEKGSHAA
jgi:hypothetical protein